MPGGSARFGNRERLPSTQFPTSGDEQSTVLEWLSLPSDKQPMATCPRCFGALTDNHKCPKGMFSRVSDAISTVGIGGGLGAVLCFAIEERPVGALVVAAAALGAVLAFAVRQAVGGRP